MTDRVLTTLAIRIAGIFLFIKIFDHFGSYFLSIYGTAVISELSGLSNDPINKFYFTGTFLTLANIVVSVFLFLKADWISKKLIKSEKEIITELNPRSLSKVILLTVGIVWLATSIYLIPDFITFIIDLIAKFGGDKDVEMEKFDVSRFIIRTIIALILIFRIEKITNWITRRI